MSIEDVARAKRKKLEDVDQEDLEEIDDSVLVKIYTESFHQGY